MGKREEILKRYQILCKYCDTLFLTVTAKYKPQINCCKGCCSCCEIDSVNALEMWSICRYIKSQQLSLSNNVESSCAMLKEGCCMIYPVRPLICRTHGLIVKSNEFSHLAIRTCNKNFTFNRNIDANLVLDASRITMNLVRLNYAFCLTIGRNELKMERFKLKSLLLTSDTQEFFDELMSYV